MKKYLSRLLFYIVVAACVGFSIFAFVRVSARSDPAEPTDLVDAPQVLHGFVEPAGREVFVCAPVTKTVVAVYVSEGDTVAENQALCRLDSEVELRELDLARAKVRSAEKAVELADDYFDRQKQLYDDEAVAEQAFTNARIEAELARANLEVARAEVNRAEAVLERLELRAPVAGIVYRFDVRLGEMLVAGAESDCPIVLGSSRLSIRLYVESFWADGVRAGSKYRVFDSESGEFLGAAEVISRSSFVSRKVYRTDEPGERFDTGYLEAVLSFDPVKPGVPIGLSVYARSD
ncbi:MAG: hypothetical protein PVJ42_04255 [bacterium]|jgi:multidrug efflux pump subunit AcrA (membrane-fusion protein)